MTVLGQQLISSVRAHAAQNPDFVYKSPFDDTACSFGACVYVYNGCGSCLIGHALFDAGIIDASFESDDRNHYPIRKIIDEFDLKLAPEEMQWLRDVQHCQDTYDSWGRAVAHADSAALADITNPKRTWAKVID